MRTSNKINLIHTKTQYTTSNYEYQCPFCKTIFNLYWMSDKITKFYCDCGKTLEVIGIINKVKE